VTKEALIPLIPRMAPRILSGRNFRNPGRARPVVSISEFCAGSNQEFRRINVAFLLEQGQRRVISPSRSNGRYRSQWNCHFSLAIPGVNSSGKFQLVRIAR